MNNNLSYKLSLQAYEETYSIYLTELFTLESGASYKVAKELLNTSNSYIASAFMVSFLQRLDVKCWDTDKKVVSIFQIEYNIKPSEIMWEMIERIIGIKQ